MSTPIADMVDQMLAAGASREMVVMAVRGAEIALSRVESRVDVLSDKRRAWDREYRRRKRGTSTRQVNPTSTRQSNKAEQNQHPRPPDMSADSVVRVSTLKKKLSKSRGARLDVGWTPGDAEMAFAKGRRPDLSADQIADEVTKFRNHWTAKAGRDATKLDWSRTWQNWILNARPSRLNGKGHSEQSYKPSVVDFDFDERPKPP